MGRRRDSSKPYDDINIDILSRITFFQDCLHANWIPDNQSNQTGVRNSLESVLQQILVKNNKYNTNNFKIRVIKYYLNTKYCSKYLLNFKYHDKYWNTLENV